MPERGLRTEVHAFHGQLRESGNTAGAGSGWEARESASQSRPPAAPHSWHSPFIRAAQSGHLIDRPDWGPICLATSQSQSR
jgi:hypothetical protein